MIGKIFESFFKWEYDLFHCSGCAEYSGGDDYWFMFIMTIISILLIGLIGSLIFGGIYYSIDLWKSSWEELSGKIIDKKYVGETNSTGTGVGVSGEGTAVVVSTSSHSSEEFLLFVINAGKVYKIETNMQYFYKCNVGDKANFRVQIGGISGDQLKIELI